MADPRNYQIVFLSGFLLLGFTTRGWDLKGETVAIALITCLVTQAIATMVVGKTVSPMTSSTTPLHLSPKWNWRSPLITGLGLSLLLRVEQPLWMAIAAAAAILSKFCLRSLDKHWFNPANFGLVVALSLPIPVWVSPGQWGEDSLYGLVFLGAGGLVLGKVGRWDTTAMFLGSYGLLEGLRLAWLGWTPDVWSHRMLNGSLLLFALFMVTDPRSIPNTRTGRLLWAGAIALVAFLLRNYLYRADAVFWALFALSPLTRLVDRWFVGDRFNWAVLPQTSDDLKKTGV